MKRFMLLAVLAAAVIGCGLLHDDPSLVVTSPKYGEEYKIGDNVTITWECRDCDHIVGRTVKISLFPEGGGQIPFSYEISEEFLTGSLAWRAGVVKRGTVQPGFYFISFYTECTDRSSADVYSCAAQSGLFKLVR